MDLDVDIILNGCCSRKLCKQNNITYRAKPNIFSQKLNQITHCKTNTSIQHQKFNTGLQNKNINCPTGTCIKLILLYRRNVSVRL